MAPARFGLIGAGAIAQAYSEAFLASDRAVLVAVADVREDAAAAVARIHACAHFGSAQELWDKAEVDAVVICTPPVTHRDLCVEAMSHGVHVLCEKPLAIDSAGARAMLAAA
ncbi:MAG TPA: Gfo/Idh/MocA family oxidoreductase, partial [Pirellulaceae bacterium]